MRARTSTARRARTSSGPSGPPPPPRRRRARAAPARTPSRRLPLPTRSRPRRPARSRPARRVERVPVHERALVDVLRALAQGEVHEADLGDPALVAVVADAGHDLQRPRDIAEGPFRVDDLLHRP